MELISPEIESVLRETILPDLEKGRKDFDRPHTEAVVYWVKTLLTLLNDPNLNAKVLITSGYAHDWGYYQLFEGVNASDPVEIKKRKPLHMDRGAAMIRTLLLEKLATSFSEAEIEEVAHLVQVHDLVEQVQTDSEVLLMEADTLGMLDTDLVIPTFSKEDNAPFMENEIKNRRFPHFIHQPALEAGKIVIKKRAQYYANL